jgi:hypothetical protein
VERLERRCLKSGGGKEMMMRCMMAGQAGRGCVSLFHSCLPRESQGTHTSKTTSAASRPPIEWPTSTTSVVGDSWGASQLLK